MNNTQSPLEGLPLRKKLTITQKRKVVKSPRLKVSNQIQEMEDVEDVNEEEQQEEQEPEGEQVYVYCIVPASFLHHTSSFQHICHRKCIVPAPNVISCIVPAHMSSPAPNVISCIVPAPNVIVNASFQHICHLQHQMSS